jgi:Zn ribbon nucleic-acid-binding protein
MKCNKCSLDQFEFLNIEQRICVDCGHIQVIEEDEEEDKQNETRCCTISNSERNESCNRVS